MTGLIVDAKAAARASLDLRESRAEGKDVRLQAFVSLLNETEDGYMLRQLCALLYRYLEKRGRLPGA